MTKENINQNCEMQEDEIDLKELFATIYAGRYFIVVFVFISTLLTLVYVLSKPNVYTVQTVLIPIERKSGASLGGLGALASMAGVSVGGGEVGPTEAFNALLHDYGSMKWWIEKESLYDVIEQRGSKDYIFAFGSRFLYDLFHSESKDKEDKDKETKIFDTFKSLTNMISINEDKKSGMITLSVKNSDRILAKNILESLLKEASAYLIQNDLENNKQQLHYYRESLKKVQDLQIRASMASQISALIQNSIMLKSSPYYKVKMLTKPSIPNVKGKTAPKRGLILVVSVITSTILAIFILFFMNFIKKED
jgi:uncharacterized protein involved in exopolysaccharide biosynthesis